MDIRFEDRVAVVTGAGTGLGRSHALMLAKRGAKVVVNDLGVSLSGAGSSARAADMVVEEIRANGGEAIACYESIAAPEGAQGVIEHAIRTFGRIDILVNNAGILRDKSFGKMPLEDFDSVVKVHLAGAAYCTHAAWPYMSEKKYGRIVFTLSNTGLYGNFGQANYGAGKAGLIGLMNVLKIEGLKNNILVNAIAPMAVTRMTEAMMDPLFRPEYPSAAVAYLCSEQFKGSGTIISSAAGHYSAVQIVSSTGAQLRGEPTPEAVANLWNQISDMSGARGFASAAEELSYVSQKAGVVVTA